MSKWTTSQTCLQAGHQEGEKNESKKNQDKNFKSQNKSICLGFKWEKPFQTYKKHKYFRLKQSIIV